MKFRLNVSTFLQLLVARVRECTFFPSSSTLKKQQWKKCIIEIDENVQWEKKEASNL